MTQVKEIKSMEDFAKILEESHKTTVLLCKFSPICHVSSEAESQFNEYLQTEPQNIAFYKIDVVYSRDTSRRLAKEIDVKHESPQALLFKNGKCIWNDSHYRLTKEAFQDIAK